MDELCTLVYIQTKHTTGPGKPTKDGEMNHVTLSSRTGHSDHGGLRPSTLSLIRRGSLNTQSLRVNGEGIFVSLR